MKRAPSSTLTHDNWDREEEPEEAGTFQRASSEQVKKRVIAKARRKRNLNTSSNGSSQPGEEKKSAFAGFGAKLNPKEDSPVPSLVSQDVSSQESESQESNKENKSSKTADKEILKLNSAFVKSVQKYFDDEPVCDFSPMFEDYKNHMSRIDEAYKTVWKERGSSTIVNSETDETEETEEPTTVIEKKSSEKRIFCTPESSQEVKSSQEEEKTEKSEKEAPKFSFKPSDPEKAKKFSFAPTQSSDPPKFSFKPSNGSSDPPKFSFKSSEPTKSDSSKPTLFNLGGAPKTDSSASKPAFTFKFGAGASSLAGGAAPSFGFGAPPSSIPTPAPAGGDGEDEYQPPKVEETEFDDEKDALYTKKAKLFYSKDGNYKEIGVGKLFVKPLDGNKGQILVRADNTLGNILMNVKIPSKPEPSAVGKNNCLIPMVPNPPIDGVEGAVPILIRVKTAEDRDELIETIKSRQNE